jgi:ribosomal-protein-alanine N-acetyltransferase
MVRSAPEDVNQLRDPRIRQATLRDLAAILEIEYACFTDHRFTDNKFVYHLRSPNSIFFMATEGAQLAGYIMGAIDGRYSPRIARVDSVAVLPAYRREGLARLMMSAFEREARNRGSAAIVLEVYARNFGAIRLYEALGYCRSRLLPDYYGSRKNGIEMRKAMD